MVKATLEKCDICGKDYKNINAHKRMAHPDAGLKSKSVEDIARILYEDIVKPLCQERGISIGEWEGIDQSDYLTVARKIKG